MLVHPDDPDTLVIVGAEFLTSTCHVHVSRDRGRTWIETAGQPLPPAYRACSRPTFGPSIAAEFGIDGTLYVVNAASDSAGGRGSTDAYVARSTDLGETWEFSFIRRSTEREFLLGDGTTKTAAERYAYVRMAVHPTDPNLVYAGFRV
ncbi:MAG: hypothetical protein M3O70_04670, partial [Actinomycetota bacterium]|nr:hypothetical protein [Actinomycetota bacterium]